MGMVELEAVPMLKGQKGEIAIQLDCNAHELDSIGFKENSDMSCIERPSLFKRFQELKEVDRPIGILGTGNYGTALAKRFQMSGIKFILGSRSTVLQSGEFDEHVVSYDKLVMACDLILLCVPRHAYDSIVKSLKPSLNGKIVVDVSNLENARDSSNALYLQSALPETFVVKALNTVSAYSLENEAYGATRDTFVCGNDRYSREQVAQLMRDLGLNPVDRGLLTSAASIETLPFRFFEGWGTAFIITMCTLILIMLYYYLRLFWANRGKVSKELSRLTLYHGNRVIAWLALWLLSLTYLPGCLACFIQLAWGTKYRRFPGWLDRWMKCRKQLGLITLTIAGMHMCLSCIMMGTGYIYHMLKEIPIPGTKLSLLRYMDVKDQLSIMFATIAFTLMSVVGITSLPSVNARMSWREWDFIQRGVGFATLIFAFLHVLVYVYRLYDPNNKLTWKPYWKYNMPPAAFLMPMLPGLVIFLKLVLLSPGIVCYLNRIRSGRVDGRRLK